jgi:hypothetical protein
MSPGYQRAYHLTGSLRVAHDQGRISSHRVLRAAGRAADGAAFRVLTGLRNNVCRRAGSPLWPMLIHLVISMRTSIIQSREAGILRSQFKTKAERGYSEHARLRPTTCLWHRLSSSSSNLLISPGRTSLTHNRGEVSSSNNYRE